MDPPCAIGRVRVRTVLLLPRGINLYASASVDSVVPPPSPASPLAPPCLRRLYPFRPGPAPPHGTTSRRRSPLPPPDLLYGRQR
jgi:hypothetical protein